MYISYRKVHGNEYATVAESRRVGNKVICENVEYLGRVIDKNQNIFKSKNRGVYQYDLDNLEVLPLPKNYAVPKITRKNAKQVRSRLILSFGDVYVLDTYINRLGFYRAVDSLGYKNTDTLRALLLFYLLCPHANQYANNWFELSYVKYLYPNANLSSQNISVALKDIGSEEAKRSFFKIYSNYLDTTHVIQEPTIKDGILIDSTGLPNSIHLPITAVNNHNGKISEEIRLIFVVQQSTGLPLYFRYVDGNIIDASTITRTIAELKANGVNTKFAILDSGYYTEYNADILFENEISFLSRLGSHFKIYKKVISEHLSNLEIAENLLNFNGRTVFVKRVEVMVGKKSSHHAYAYLCKDLKMKRKLESEYEEYASKHNISKHIYYEKLAKQGIFILISSRKIAANKILQIYYLRDKIEKIFEIDKSYCKLLPLNVETLDTFRGHLMMTFMATVVYKLLQDKFKENNLPVEFSLYNLHEQRVSIYDDELITSEPTKDMNDIYKALKIECPVILKLCEGKLM